MMTRDVRCQVCRGDGPRRKTRPTSISGRWSRSRAWNGVATGRASSTSPITSWQQGRRWPNSSLVREWQPYVWFLSAARSKSGAIRQNSWRI